MADSGEQDKRDQDNSAQLVQNLATDKPVVTQNIYSLPLPQIKAAPWTATGAREEMIAPFRYPRPCEDYDW